MLVCIRAAVIRSAAMVGHADLKSATPPRVAVRLRLWGNCAPHIAYTDWSTCHDSLRQVWHAFLKHVITGNAQVRIGVTFLPICSYSGCILLMQFPDGLGGGCKFIDPQTTLKAGHCDGGLCIIDDVSHPSVIRGQLSI